MTSRLSLSLLLLAAVAGCDSTRQIADAPMPPEEIAEPTGGNRDPEAPATYQVLLDTTEGEVVIDIDRSLAPRGADRFYRLVKEGYYDGAKFFRVVPGFVAQFGMAADPEVNAKWDDATIPDDPVKASNTKGTITFATSGPDSRTAQIFINLGDNSGPPPQLDAQGFAPFGEVTKGMDVVENFYDGYGEAPQQGRIAIHGNEYLDAAFPELDAIKTARIISENGEPVAAAADSAEPVTDETEPAAEAVTEGE